MTKTWENLNEMMRGVMLMLQANEYFAWQFVKKGFSKDGSTQNDAPYKPCFDLNQLTQHRNEIFEGVKTAGFYSIRPDNLTRWGALDFDDHDNLGLQWSEPAEKAYKAFSLRFDECWLLETSPGGYHVISFTKDPIPAKDFRLALKEHAPTSVEVFPKQDVLGDKPGAKGSLLRFPGKHLLKDTWGRFIDRSGRIEIGNQSLKQPLKKWEIPSFRGNMESLYIRMTRGLEITAKGQRFNAMKRLGGKLKGRAERDEAIWIYKKWHNRYASKIETPFDESLKSFLIWFDAASPCNVEIPPYATSEEEETRLVGLPKLPNIKPEILKDVARLFYRVRSHAQSKGIEAPWLSCRTISEELGISVPTASRYRQACVRLGLVKVIEIGHSGFASTYSIK